MTRIKICGLMSIEDIGRCCEAGVHALGFVVEYPREVPWNLDRYAARRLMQSVPPFVTRVVVVGGDAGTVIALTEFLRPDVIQLHGDEPPEETARMVDGVKPYGVRVIKALRFDVETGRCLRPFDDPWGATRSIEGAGADALLLDSASRLRPAGTGASIDWGLARSIRERARLPVILAGGLDAGNVGRAVAVVDPYGVDVISGVEGPVGQKDPRKIRAFVDAVTVARRRA
mgnify:FL=1